MLVFVGSGILRRMFGTFGGAFVTGGVAGVLVWILTSVAGDRDRRRRASHFCSRCSGGGGGGRGWTSSRRGGLGRWLWRRLGRWRLRRWRRMERRRRRLRRRRRVGAMVINMAHAQR